MHAPKPLLRLMPYQRRWLDDSARFKIGMFARQTGKTFMNCAEILKDCIEAEKNKNKTRWIILSRGERQAQEVMTEHLIPMVKAFEELYKGATHGTLFPKVHKSQNAMIFPCGSKVSVLPANPDTARGFSANLFLDEFAFHNDSNAIWRALFPVVSKNGLKLRIVSTPNGTNNMFFRLMQDEAEGWSKHRIDIYQAVKQGLPRDIPTLKKNTLDENLWKQEFELDWQDGSTRWLTRNLIVKAQNDKAGRPNLFQGGAVFIGNDIARRNDYWVAVALEKHDKKYWLREIQAHKAISFREQDQRLDRMVQRYKAQRIAMDATGIGEKPVEDAAQRYGKSKTIAVNFTSARKLDLATRLKRCLQEETLLIPPCSILFDDLHAMRAQHRNNTTHLKAESSQHNADRFWAIALALLAAQKETPFARVRSVRSDARQDTPFFSQEF